MTSYGEKICYAIYFNLYEWNIFLRVRVMVFNATFNNISDISWQSVLLIEETEGPGENHDLSHVTDKLYHIMLYTSPWSRFEPTTS